MGTRAGRIAASAFALAVVLCTTVPAVADDPGSASAVRSELSGLLRDLERAARSADSASARWMTLRLRVAEARAEETEARDAFESRVRQAYVAGPGRAAEFLLSSSDLHEFAARLPYATTSLSLGRIDVNDIAARRRALEEVLAAAGHAQRVFADAESRLGAVRAAIEKRLARAETAARADARSLDDVRALRKTYKGTLDRVAGATRTIRRRKGEAMFQAAAPYLGPRKDCSIPAGLRSTGDKIAGEASWYGEEFRGKPTASGAIYYPERYTVAHRTLPFGLFLLIRFRDRCVVSFLNDRGPYVDGRILDLSGGSAKAVGLTGVQDISATLLVRAG